MNDNIVVGGGFQGIFAAAHLAKLGQEVTLIEKAPFLGGVLNSSERDGLFLDNGCHLFSNESPDTTQFYLDVLGDDIVPVDVRYASVTDGHQRDGLAVADFSHLSMQQRFKMLNDVLVGGDESAADDMASALAARYGSTLAGHLAPAIKKMTLCEPECLAANTLQKSPFGRIGLFDRKLTEALRPNTAFDSILAVPSERNPMRFYPEARDVFPHRNFYPARHGTKGFCQRAADYLSRLGVKVCLGLGINNIANRPGGGIECALEGGETLSAESCVWALGPGLLAAALGRDDPLQGYQQHVPMVLYYFLMPHDAHVTYTYMHDFSPDTSIFRLSSPGFYGRQANDDGLSYLCAEVPAATDSAIWQEPDRFTDSIWDEVCGLGMTTASQPARTIIRKTPVSYPLNRPGYNAAREQVCGELADAMPDVLLADTNMFSKVDIVRSLTAELE